MAAALIDSPTSVEDINRYFLVPGHTDQSDREVARAIVFAGHYGLETISRDDDSCVIFAEPTCGTGTVSRPIRQLFEAEFCRAR